jgi:hypothetical protein
VSNKEELEFESLYLQHLLLGKGYFDGEMKKIVNDKNTKTIVDKVNKVVMIKAGRKVLVKVYKNGKMIDIGLTATPDKLYKTLQRYGIPYVVSKADKPGYVTHHFKM